MSDEDARDLAQEVFVQFYERMGDIPAGGEWKYLKTLARHIALNKIREQGSKRRDAIATTTDLDTLATVADASAAPDEMAISRERREKLNAAIAELPSNLRTLLLLWLEERTYTEIAEMLAISVDAVKSRLHDARSRLHAKLGESYLSARVSESPIAGAPDNSQFELRAKREIVVRVYADNNAVRAIVNVVEHVLDSVGFETYG
jgi:RNA polymerase sigma-70 factor (ECF subfamily)